MGVKITGRPDFESLKRSFMSELEKNVNTVLLGGKTLIEARATRGEGYQGKWPGYTEEYKRRSGKTDPPNLRVTGAMFRNLQLLETRQSGDKVIAKLGFNDDLQSKKADGNSKKRPFLGFKKSDLAAFSKKIGQNINIKIR